MKYVNVPLFCVVAALALLLPAPCLRSQLAVPTDPLATIQAMETANDDLLKRQDATLKDLSDMTDTAREVRILAKRG